MHTLDGAPPLRSCNEVEVAKALRRIRDKAFWMSAYPTARMPEFWRPWVRSSAELPPWLRTLDASIRLIIGSRNGGMPDVVAWNDDAPLTSALFVECKGPKENVKEAQEDWLWAALKNGLTVERFAVSIRPF